MIALVAHDRQSRMGQLHPDLVRAARVKRNVHERLPVCSTDGLIGQLCELRARRSLRHDEGRMRALVLAEPIREIGGGFRCAVRDRCVAFLRGMGFELRGETRCRLARFCKDHHAADRAVKTVDKPEIGLARFVARLAQIPLCDGEQVGVARCVRLHGQVLRFFEHKQVIVLIEHGEPMLFCKVSTFVSIFHRRILCCGHCRAVLAFRAISASSVRLRRREARARRGGWEAPPRRRRRSRREAQRPARFSAPAGQAPWCTN